MSDVENDSLVQLFIEDVARGKSYYDIELKHGVPAAEVRVMVKDYLAEHYVRDRGEWQQLLTLRIEKITDYLWDGITAGNFKNAEAVVRLIEKLAELLALNDEAQLEHDSKLTDSQTQQILQVLRKHDQLLLDMINENLSLSNKNKTQLAEWPEWTAEAATSAVEQVVYAELED